MAYIDVDKFADAICEFSAIDEHSANAVILLLRRQPTADVVKVVRCKDCYYRQTHVCAITGAKTLFCDYWDKPYPVEEEHYCGCGKSTPQKEG